MSSAPYLKWLHEVELSDIPTVGGKNASLGEMIQNLGKLGVQVPGGFVVTVASYEAFIAHNVLDQKIRDIVAGLDVDDVENIRRTGLDFARGATLVPAGLIMSEGAISLSSIRRQRPATSSAFRSAKGGAPGRQRLHARKPARSASAIESKKRTCSGRGNRAPQSGRQNTPVVSTE